MQALDRVHELLRLFFQAHKDGRYLILVVGPFANLSDDFVIVLFLGRARVLKAINDRNTNPKHALTMNFRSYGFFGVGSADSFFVKRGYHIPLDLLPVQQKEKMPLVINNDIVAAGDVRSSHLVV